MKPKIVCLCGSTRFKKTYERVIWEEGLAGKIVLSVCAYVHADKIKITEDQKKKLDELHFRKIDLAGEILVINEGGYIGWSTAREINYAKKKGKHIRYVFEQGGLNVLNKR